MPQSTIEHKLQIRGKVSIADMYTTGTEGNRLRKQTCRNKKNNITTKLRQMIADLESQPIKH